MKIKTLKLSDNNFYQSLKNALSFDEEDNSRLSFVRIVLPANRTTVIKTAALIISKILLNIKEITPVDSTFSVFAPD